MSQSDETASDAEQGELPIDSIYDFLYHDARRIGSFLAQLDPSGHLTGVKQTEGAESSSSMKFGANASGTIAIARGSATLEDQSTAGERETLERTYDPLWANALGLLDILDERHMIQRQLSQASIGQFVLISGQLLVLDLGMLKSAWANPAIQTIIQGGAEKALPPEVNRKQRRANMRGGEKTQTPNDMDVVFALVGMMPHGLQCRLIGENVNVWCSLDEKSMVTQTADLILKHGTLIQGEWSILGIFDAYPIPDQSDEQLPALLAEIVATPIGQLSATLSPITRTLLGRPNIASGITPLLIFRKVNG